MRIVGFMLLVWGLVASAGPATAAMTQNDVVIAARALSFTANPPTGEVTAGIVYDPRNSQSTEEADALSKILAGGLKVGNLVLKPMLIKVDEIAAANVAFFVLTEGLAADGMKVAAASREKRRPCVTADIAQVRNGACTIGVQSRPKVAILVNRKVAADSGIAFAAVFRMMITEF